MSIKNIVILCYSFPPNPGVGGRRWVKFAGELKRLNKHVTVLTVYPNKTGKVSTYTADADSMDVIFYGKRAPTYLSGITKNFIEKIGYRLQLLYRSIRIKGTPFDLAGLDTRKVLSALTELENKKKIDVIIATGAPFHHLYIASKYKKKHPKVQLICDFRDPWVEGGNYGIAQLTKRKWQQENEKEAFVVKYADIITVPDEHMQGSLIDKYRGISQKIKVLPHGYDQNLIIQKLNYQVKEKIKLIYYGTIYNDCEAQINWLNQMLLEANGNLTLDYYGELNELYSQLLSVSIEKEFVTINSPVSEQELLKQICTYDLAIILSRLNYGQNFITTKFYELIASKIPILFIGGSGKASSFISNHNLGVSVTNMELTYAELKIHIENLLYNNNWSEEDYSFKQLTKKLISYFVE